jgi:hypothetical protein
MAAREKGPQLSTSKQMSKKIPSTGENFFSTSATWSAR